MSETRDVYPHLNTEDIRDELRRFNDERRAVIGKPPAPGERMPLPYSGVGGDVGPEG